MANVVTRAREYLAGCRERFTRKGKAMVKKILLWVFAVPVLGMQGIFLLSLMETREVKVELPKPHYQPKPTDPAWLAQAVQFHGHLGPWATAGVRFGVAGRQAVGAQGYFDLQVRCQGPLERPPRACFLDGLQVGTGATMGKRNIHWEPGEELIVWVKNTRTGQTAELRPTPFFWQWLTAARTKSQPTGSTIQEAEEHDHGHGAAPSAKASPSQSPGPDPGKAGGSSSAEQSASEPDKPAGTPEAAPAEAPQAAEDPVEAAARQIATLPEAKILTVKILPAP